MAHKHELQDFIFTMEDNSSNLNVIAVDITHIIVQLEIAAFKLQMMMVCFLSNYIYYICILSVMISLQLKHHNKPCVEFSAAQYHDIYISRFHNQSTVYDSLVNSATIWKNKTDNCLKWRYYSW